ncbi:MAG: hypothetical protein DI598_18195, partial [Pseudopedobacter saltans]
LSSIAGYRPGWGQLSGISAHYGFLGYATWFWTFGIALIGSAIWSIFDNKRSQPAKNYNQLYYWLRVIVRYRIALGIIAFGFLKVYPMQMPPPAISNLETNIGDYNTYKIYWQQLGIVIWYEVLLGFVEVLGGVLMFFRRTSAIGAFINAGVLLNIAHANFAYDGGVHVYSSLFVLFSIFILLPYLKNLWTLFILRKEVNSFPFFPQWKGKKKTIYLIVKSLIVVLFTIVYGILRYDVHYKQGYLKDPIKPGLSNAAGFYNVSTFKLNGTEIAYSPYDSVRWQNVIFEKWSTLTYQVYHSFDISLENGTPAKNDWERNYELAGIAGGRRFLFYKLDTIKQTLLFQDKNFKKYRTDNNDKSKGKNRKKDEGFQPLFSLHYERVSNDKIILSGKNENKDSLYIVLDRVRKEYPVYSGL